MRLHYYGKSISAGRDRRRSIRRPTTSADIFAMIEMRRESRQASAYSKIRADADRADLLRLVAAI